MLVFFDAQVVVQYGFIPEGNSVNKEIYVEPCVPSGMQ
jgi:hypothetical protein